MESKYEVFPARDGFRWRLVAANGEIVAQSEAYTTEGDAARGAEDAAAASQAAGEIPVEIVSE